MFNSIWYIIIWNSIRYIIIWNCKIKKHSDAFKMNVTQNVYFGNLILNLFSFPQGNKGKIEVGPTIVNDLR